MIHSERKVSLLIHFIIHIKKIKYKAFSENLKNEFIDILIIIECSKSLFCRVELMSINYGKV